MKYIAPAPIGKPFTLTQNILSLHSPICTHHQYDQYINKQCIITELIIYQDNVTFSYPEVYIPTQSHPKHIDPFTLKPNDYYQNPSLAQYIPTLLEIEDVVIDSFTRRWFTVQSCFILFIDNKYEISYHLESSDNQELTISEEKLKFYIDNNIFYHAQFRKEN